MCSCSGGALTLAGERLVSGWLRWLEKSGEVPPKLLDMMVVRGCSSVDVSFKCSLWERPNCEPHGGQAGVAKQGPTSYVPLLSLRCLAGC